MVVIKYYYNDQRVRRYAEALYEANVQVDVLCVSGQAQTASGMYSGVRVYTIPLERRRGSTVRYLFEYGVSFILFGIQLLRHYFKTRYHVIHVHNLPDILIFIALIPRLFGAKLILDIHDPMPEFFMAKYRKPEAHFLIKLLKTQEKVSTWMAHAIITVNNTCKDHLVARGISADKITVIRNLPEPEIFNREKYEQERKLPHQYFTMVYPGTITSIYGLDVAIQALPILTEKIPEIRLVLIGKRETYVNELLDFAKKLGVSEYVEFKPYIPQDQMPLEYARADIGIMTARSSPILDIGVPGKLIEYALMGIPIIATRLKALEDWFTESSILFFESGNVEQFAACVLELFEHPALREQLVQNMDHTFVQTQSWATEKDKYYKLINRLSPQSEAK